jgi:hypothetical protein
MMANDEQKGGCVKELTLKGCAVGQRSKSHVQKRDGHEAVVAH